MFRLKELLTEGRSEPISKRRAKSIYENEASNFRFGKHTSIFRGNKNLTTNFAVINPSQHNVRKSENTKNYYTLIINNAESWSKYPKREVICTTSSEKAEKFGNVYYVVPFDNTDWGICPDYDIWRSFPNLFEKSGTIGLMDEFNKFIDNIVDEILYKDVDDHSLESLKDDLNDAAYFIRENSLFNKPRDEQPDIFHIYSDLLDNFKNSEYYHKEQLAQYLIDIMDPVKNGFEYQNNWKGAARNKEVWTDGPCLLVKDGLMHIFT